MESAIARKMYAVWCFGDRDLLHLVGASGKASPPYENCLRLRGDDMVITRKVGSGAQRTGRTRL